jgi:pimeloyl-ACP methyl ester carboxylesterase
VNSLVHGLFGRPVTEDDLARFLELAGFVDSAQVAPSHPNWDRWLPHRMALSWQGERVDHPERSVEELARITCPVLLTKGTNTAAWLKRLVDVLGERLPNASVVELEGDHAHHLQSIDAFLERLEGHLTRADAVRIA